MDHVWNAVASSSKSVLGSTWPFMQVKQDGSISSSTSSLLTPSPSSITNDYLSKSSVPSHHWWEYTKWSDEEINTLLWNHRTVVAAGTASLVSTTASFPFDSLKSRLQVKHYPSIWACAKAVLREEGFQGFFRGVTIPLITISIVRTSSFSIYFNTKDSLHKNGYLADRSKLTHTALSGMAGGATSGVIISCGSAPFELVKVQRQLEYLTAMQKGLVAQMQGKFVARSGFRAALDIWRYHGGPKGFYIGFPLHICRDTLGTAFYFGFYDTIRSLVTRYSKGNSSTGPQLFGLPGPVVSFLSGSTAGIASWLIVYPIDLLKTNVQQRTLSNHPNQLTGYQLFKHLLRERPPNNPSKGDTFVKRFLRLYRGLGVSAFRSFIS
jgi:solute carrier family 25 carnitine/acylcarnitine transporter 20/29